MKGSNLEEESGNEWNVVFFLFLQIASEAQSEAGHVGMIVTR